MIKLAILYNTKLAELLLKCLTEKRNNFLFFLPYKQYSFCIEDNDHNKIQYISIDKDNNILGFFEATINTNYHVIDDMLLISFNDLANQEFGLDLVRFIDLLFIRRNYRQIYFKAVTANPIYSYYERFLLKVTKSGCIIGVMKSYVRLSDNQYYDLAIFCIYREKYLKWVNERPKMIFK